MPSINFKYKYKIICTVEITMCFLQTDWNDGLAAAALVKSKGGPVPGFRQMTNR